MTIRMVTLTPAHAALAAALHAESGLPESWGAQAFGELLGMTGVAGALALEATGPDAGVEEGDPVGLALWRCIAGEGEILTICVRAEARRKGIARHMLEDAAAHMGRHGVGRIFLEVAIDNEPALALYHRQGFRPEGRRRNYYQTARGPRDALILARDP
jgi:ribosomal-protein-alanine N-acetyltransferase